MRPEPHVGGSRECVEIAEIIGNMNRTGEKRRAIGPCNWPVQLAHPIGRPIGPCVFRRRRVDHPATTPHHNPQRVCYSLTVGEGTLPTVPKRTVRLMSHVEDDAESYSRRCASSRRVMAFSWSCGASLVRLRVRRSPGPFSLANAREHCAVHPTRVKSQVCCQLAA